MATRHKKSSESARHTKGRARTAPAKKKADVPAREAAESELPSDEDTERDEYTRREDLDRDED